MVSLGGWLEAMGETWTPESVGLSQDKMLGELRLLAQQKCHEVWQTSAPQRHALVEMANLKAAEAAVLVNKFPGLAVICAALLCAALLLRWERFFPEAIQRLSSVGRCSAGSPGAKPPDAMPDAPEFRAAQMPNFPGDEPLDEDGDSDEESMDFAQGSTREAIERLAKSELFVPPSWCEEADPKDEEEDLTGQTAELVGTLRELADVNRRRASTSSAPYRRTATFPEVTQSQARRDQVVVITGDSH
ncbi:unnamed protein product [Effrenium voratum]|uniref:Uncharacterized protein n=1 Tax=Effrenium voratum TaxID=2562239 RepID=A0AA36MU67_9DINO|nr:unnamed protein product [Effrenium voratum]